MAIIALEKSRNEKTGKVSATYAPRQTCPDACPLKRGGGCYGTHSNCALHTARITAEAEGKSPAELATIEADAIDKLSGKRPLRLHVVGDCPTAESAEIIAAACARYSARHGQLVWAFTHAWRTIPRASWGSISILASCERPEQAIEAAKRGYATALICPEEKIAKYAKCLAMANVFPRLCAHFVNGTPCVECGLCLHDPKQTCILLPPHGPVKQLREVIK